MEYEQTNARTSGAQGPHSARDWAELEAEHRRTTPPPPFRFDGPAWPLSLRRAPVIVNLRRGEFIEHPDGTEANILDVLDEHGEVIDAVMWCDAAPYAWALRHRAATFLGAAEILRAASMDVRLNVLDHPAAWVKNYHAPDGRWPACVVVDWSAQFEVVPALSSLKIRASWWVQKRRRQAARELIEKWSEAEMIKPGGT